MPVSYELGEDIGKILRNLKQHSWIAAQVGNQAIGALFVNPMGKHVHAFLKAHLIHHENDQNGKAANRKIADIYEVDGVEYMDFGGQKYRHDRNRREWVQA